MLAKRYALPYIDLSRTSINTDALRLIPENEARAAGLAAFRIIGKTVHVAIISPNNQKVKEITEGITNRNLEVATYLASENSLERAWAMYSEVSSSEIKTAKK